MAATDTSSVARARKLGDLLRARREHLQPADVGVLAGSRRRTPGLRREEVARPGISPTYDAFLEQERKIRPSRQVLDALARALRLADAERAHLHELVHGAPAPVTADRAEETSPAVAALVERLDPCPTSVTGRGLDAVAANHAARAQWITALSAPERDGPAPRPAACLTRRAR